MEIRIVICLVLFLTVVVAKLTLLCDNPIDGLYIVLYHDNTTSEQFNEHRVRVLSDDSIKYTYTIGDTFKGFAAKLDKRTLNQLLDDSLIKEIHCNGIVTIAENSCGSTQPNVPSWGLARVSFKGGFATQQLRDEYFYDATTSGQGVDAYILDTGIYIEHVQFEGRARYGINLADNIDTDENSHGTHCAGIVGGRTFGISKAVTLIAVKVLGASGSGTVANVIRGVEWVTQEYIRTRRPSVASMSLGSTTNGGLNEALTASFNVGVVYSVAAGGSGTSACNFYPASCPEALTAGSTIIINRDGQDYDQRTSSSNYGPCVDIWAPGSTITSCDITSPDSFSTRSGTSMSCAHITGVVATLLSQNPNMRPPELSSKLLGMAQRDLIENVGAGSHNALVYNGCDES